MKQKTKPNNKAWSADSVPDALPVNKKLLAWLTIIFIPLFVGAIWYGVEKQGNDFNYHLLLGGLLVGLLAQSFTSALGMGFGVISNAFLLAFGVPPVVSTASIHFSELFITAAAGLSHWYYRSVNKKIMIALITGGVVGALVGVYFVSHFNGKALKPYISVYLLLMGLYILYRGFGPLKIKIVKSFKEVPFFGLVAGFVDSVGGGGWGTILTTTLLAQGRDPRTTAGSVNTARFFITVASATAFFAVVGITHYEVVIGMIISGVFISPFGARVARTIPPRILYIAAGILISVLSSYSFVTSIKH